MWRLLRFRCRHLFLHDPELSPHSKMDFVKVDLVMISVQKLAEEAVEELYTPACSDSF